MVLRAGHATDRAAAARTQVAMLTMHKLDIAAVEAAFND
jgi:hypothetical protein